MSLLDPVFPAFLAAVLALYWLAPGATGKNLVLVVASAGFYGWIEPRMVLVLLGSALLDYLLALAIERWPARPRGFVAASAVVHVGVLAWFKYLAWGVDSVVQAARSVGLDLDWTVAQVALPLGLSFYSFQTLGYTIDVARGQVRARSNLLDYLAFVLFFPQLVSGPIPRARRLLPQLERDRTLSLATLRSGLTLALWGAFSKVVVADTIAPYVDAVRLLPNPPGVLVWTTALAFGVQVFADLSGYTNLARGTARMLGIELGINFREPYLAATTPEFWRRWHISLSSWVRDYLLVPLLGRGRDGRPLRTAGPLLLTFLVIGMWHGAGWHYAAFGLWHAAWSGFYLAVEPRVPAVVSGLPGARAAAVLFHWLVVLTPGTVLFTSGSLGRALKLAQRPPWDGGVDAVVVAVALLSLAGFGALLLCSEWVARKGLARAWERVGTAEEPGWVLPFQTTAWSVAALALLVFHRIGARDFLYFQF